MVRVTQLTGEAGGRIRAGIRCDLRREVYLSRETCALYLGPSAHFHGLPETVPPPLEPPPGMFDT